ncbi:MAG: GIY-YIG catalytic domain-containing endonuclease [Homavirus sp.]|uniref:GIY-YIG catalytic domain-containing endonuclease n=1 Tax=Homavirus sp. TaxID=2487769 RepID=A0A3G5A9Q3_9VIRU|nr:MAG: GIY-YIG catalytic domain-containing endonuclease [Homavirus sp.]
MNKQIVEKNERCVEIYLMKCTISNKCYVGQTVSHVLNHKKYRRYGMKKRFDSHVSEAYSKKKNQCHYLNNAIKKHGKENFELSLLETCSLDKSDDRETFYIITLDTMFPNGYNLKLGTITTRLSEEGKKRVSNGVHLYYKNIKKKRFENINIDPNIPNEKYIRPLNREGSQYGWYVYIDGKKADFGGVKMDITETYKMANEFINQLRENSKTP